MLERTELKIEHLAGELARHLLDDLPIRPAEELLAAIDSVADNVRRARTLEAA